MRLVERGAQTTLWQAAALDLMERLKGYFVGESPPALDEINHAFWYACHGGRREAAEYLLRRGADLNWMPPWEKRTPFDAAQRRGAADVVAWLRKQGARSADELR